MGRSTRRPTRSLGQLDTASRPVNAESGSPHEEPASGGLPGNPATATFPRKLAEMLDNEAHVISWTNHGLSFFIRDNDALVNELLPKYFRHTKLTSFQRQLNLYGFRRITKGPDLGAYFHPQFRRDRPNLVNSMRRLPGQGATATAKYLPSYYKDVESMLGGSSAGASLSSSYGSEGPVSVTGSDDGSQTTAEGYSSDDMMSDGGDVASLSSSFSGSSFHMPSPSEPAVAALASPSPPRPEEPALPLVAPRSIPASYYTCLPLPRGGCSVAQHSHPAGWHAEHHHQHQPQASAPATCPRASGSSSLRRCVSGGSDMWRSTSHDDLTSLFPDLGLDFDLDEVFSALGTEADAALQSVGLDLSHGHEAEGEAAQQQEQQQQQFFAVRQPCMAVAPAITAA